MLAGLAFHTAGFGMFDEVYQRSSTVGIAAVAVILLMPLASIYKSDNTFRHVLLWAMDLVLIAMMVLAVLWFFSVNEELLLGLYTFTPTDMLVGAGGLFVVIELTRRAFGVPLALISVLSIIYALFGNQLPGFLAHAGYDGETVMRTLWYSFDGVFGLPVTVVLSLIFIFIIFGAVLEGTGAGAILLRIAWRVTGSLRGGPAHAAVVASSMFGTFSGSSAANVVGTGVFTIPMIKQRGFSNAFAGGVEASASTGGQFTPPVMGAAAFMIADLTGVGYINIALAALIPAMFYYASLFSAVSVEAARLGIEPVPTEERQKLSRQDIYLSSIFVIPILTIIFVLVAGRSAASAGFWATIVAAALGFLHPDFRKNPSKLIISLIRGGEQCAKIMVAVAAVGIVIGAVNQTGLGLRFSLLVLELASNSLFLALVLTALACLVLGMGLPTLPAYLIIVLILGGAVEKLGVPILIVHIFVLYFGVMSNITPPVAMAAYAAAPISGSDPLRTAIVAVRLALVGFIIPFVLVYNPSLSLVVEFELGEFVWIAARLGLAIWLFTTSLAGTDASNIGWLSRLIRFGAGIGCLVAIPWMEVSFFILGAAIVAVERYLHSRQRNPHQTSPKEEIVL